MLSLAHPELVQSRIGVWFSTNLSSLMPPHSHAVTELNFVTAGSVRYKLGPQALEVRAGELLVLPPGVRHELIHMDGKAAVWVIEVNLSDETREASRASEIDWLKTGVHQPSAAWAKKLRACTKKFWMRPAANLLPALEADFTRLLAAYQPGSEASGSQQHPAVSKARHYCESSWQEEFDVEELARHAGISASRLAHLFQEQIGLSPMQYRNYVRLQHFIEESKRVQPLLRGALSSGFGSYPQFHRVFLQVCGAPPSDHLRWLAGL